MTVVALRHGLPANPRADVSVPQYRRQDITPGIVHIGVGNFHRAHQAIYLHRLFNEGRDHDWGIVGAGIRPNDASMRDILLDQSCFSTVIELDPAGYRATISGAMIDYLPVDPKAILEALTGPEIRIVSLTVTEGGYFIAPTSGGFDENHPEIQSDAANPADPQTVFGIILAALRVRRDRGIEPFAVMSCDNLPNNGEVTRRALVGLSNLGGDDFGEWVAREVACPNSMVDCITPATGGRELELVLDKFAIEDRAPVVCEPFRQWVLEDNFPMGRPALEHVGVTFVEDVSSYELMKLRLLNGGHAVLAYAGALMGYKYVHDAIGDPLIRDFILRLAEQEIIPTLRYIPGVNFRHYLVTVLDRFGNFMIGDTITRLCEDGSNRQPKFILPTLADNLAAGTPARGLALEVAMWCRYCAGEADDGTRLELKDERAEELRAQAGFALTTPRAFLSIDGIFGSLAESEPFVAAFSHACESLARDGTAATLLDYINDS